MKKETAAIILKLFSIYMFATGLDYLFAGVIMAATSSNNLWSGDRIMILPNLSPILVGLLLWLLSGSIAAWLTKDNKSENTSPNIDVYILAKLCFAILGLFLIAKALPHVLSVIATWIILPEYPSILIDSMSLSNITTPFFSLLIGIGVFLGTERLVKVIKLIRTIGTEDRSVNGGR